VLGARVDPTSYGAATRQVLEWARRGESRYVCVATVHSVMEAWDDPGFRQVLNAADLVTPDGMPLVWMLRRLGYPDQQRVYGPDLTLYVCEAAAREGVPVGFYGGLPEALEAMVSKLRRLFPGLVVAYAWSPPFRPLTPEEDAQVVREIVKSGARPAVVLSMAFGRTGGAKPTRPGSMRPGASPRAFVLGRQSHSRTHGECTAPALCEHMVARKVLPNTAKAPRDPVNAWPFPR
jgi:UDP-N-acetyl-D-mannosaminuronic acid transferase (WecB/TagA/CpsF family)